MISLSSTKIKKIIMNFRYAVTLCVTVVCIWAIAIITFICMNLSILDVYLTLGVAALFTSIYLVLSCVIFFIELCFQICYDLNEDFFTGPTKIYFILSAILAIVSETLFFINADNLPPQDNSLITVLISHVALEGLILIVSYLVIFYSVVTYCAQKYGYSPFNLIFPLMYPFLCLPLLICLILIFAFPSSHL